MSEQRRGFTMIELLVVISIIAILATLTLNVIGDSVDQAKEAATATTVLKVNELLEKRVEAFNRAMKGATLSASADNAQGNAKFSSGWPAAAVNNNQLRPLRQRVAEIIGKKIEFRRFFPQSFSGVTDVSVESPPGSGTTILVNVPTEGPGYRGAGVTITAAPDSADLIGSGGGNGGGSGLSDFVESILIRTATAQLVNAGNATPTLTEVQTRAQELLASHDRVTESSEMLYLIITEMDVFGAPAIGADGFKAGEIGDTDGDGLIEFIDGWGQPLRFYRWPTRLVNSAPGNDGTLPVINAVERQFAGTLIKGMLPQPSSIGGFTPRDQLAVDPEDPIGVVYFEIQRLLRANTLNLSAFVNEANFHGLDTFHTPLVVSAGKDGRLGLLEPYQVKWGQVDAEIKASLASVPADNDLAYGHLGRVDPRAYDDVNAAISNIDLLSDNISNRNRRAGGRN